MYYDKQKVRLQEQRSKRASAMTDGSKSSPSIKTNKMGIPTSNSKPHEPWAKTSERAALASRSKRIKVTMPTMPWDSKKGAE